MLVTSRVERCAVERRDSAGLQDSQGHCPHPLTGFEPEKTFGEIAGIVSWALRTNVLTCQMRAPLNR
ncbi:hypothetical protein E2C01_083928 [Portunus trituberculatus]|uniref:Uncharacterized protein n=1 Tax=Portunus trituberculatus TaxID=210409 RepID=A0A5B7IWH0_PORTR|nr:hypothetical protein [Portunus trituberculatus]